MWWVKAVTLQEPKSEPLARPPLRRKNGRLVLGLFKSALPSALQDAIDELCPEWRQKHGIVPDISVTGFYGRVRELYELKGLRYSGGPHGLYTDAPPPAAGSPAISAVEARERRISGDVRKKAQKLDERLPPTLRGDGEKGPVERRLDELGTVFGIPSAPSGIGHRRAEPWLGSRSSSPRPPRRAARASAPTSWCQRANRRSVRRSSASLGGGA